MFISRRPGHSWLGICISYWKFRHWLKLSLFFLHEVISVFLMGLFTQLLELIAARKTFLDIFKYLYWNRSFSTAYQRHYLGAHELIDPEHSVLSMIQVFEVEQGVRAREAEEVVGEHGDELEGTLDDALDGFSRVAKRRPNVEG